MCLLEQEMEIIFIRIKMNIRKLGLVKEIMSILQMEGSM